MFSKLGWFSIVGDEISVAREIVLSSGGLSILSIVG